jgi:hypothetical protein
MLTPITVQLTAFQQIEILRQEIEQFEEDLKKTEARIREVLYQGEKHRYLTTLHPVFQQTAAPRELQELPELNGTRESLAAGLEAMRKALVELQASAGTAGRSTASLPQIPRPPLPVAGRSPSAANLPAQQSGTQPGLQSGLRRARFDTF